MSQTIGIDLGTTHSLAAILTSSGPELIPNALGEVLTPSVVGVAKDGDLLVGQSARDFQVLHPDRCASLFKRHMGTDWKITLDKKTFSAEELSGFVLGSLKRDAEAHLGESIKQAVITVPAYFNDQQRKATLRAGALAELDVKRIINEPTAASLAYGLHEAESEKLLLVFDLGGGTFDVSLVEMFEGTLEVRASSGESMLGGEDFTRALTRTVLQQRNISFEHAEWKEPLMLARLVQQCELAKRNMKPGHTVTIRLPNNKGEFADDGPTTTISWEQYQHCTASLVARLEMPIRRVLGDAELNRTDVDEVVLVGGATREKAVVAMVEETFGQPPVSRHHPDQVVAMGAAVQAGLIDHHGAVGDLVVTDVAPHTLGVEVSRMVAGQRRDGYFLPIIHRNTPIPVSRTNEVSTMRANQTEVAIQVFQGEARKVEGNLKLDSFSVKEIPPAPAGKESIEIRFTYDLNGVLEIEATILSTGKKTTHLITRFAREMSPDEIEKAVKKMAELKTHPREESLNRYLMTRAERLYAELPKDARVVLADLLEGFEECLEEGDPVMIQQYQQHLKSFLNRVDPESQFGDEGELEGDDSEEEDGKDAS